MRSENNLQVHELVLSLQQLGPRNQTQGVRLGLYPLWATALAQEAGFEDARIISFLLLQQNAETIYMIKRLFSSQSKQYDVSFGVSCDDLMVGVHWVVTWWNRKLESAVGQPSFL